MTFEVIDYFKQQSAATAWDWLVEKPMSVRSILTAHQGEVDDPSLKQYDE